MEIFGYHPLLKKKIELGNSGIFRPEMLKPMVIIFIFYLFIFIYLFNYLFNYLFILQGLPDDVNVIAWGLSLERPTMIQYGVDNIRDLIGPKVDVKDVRNNPICVFK